MWPGSSAAKTPVDGHSPHLSGDASGLLPGFSTPATHPPIREVIIPAILSRDPKGSARPTREQGVRQANPHLRISGFVAPLAMSHSRLRGV